MSLPHPSLILIDIDGTLVDSVPDLAFCINTMLDKLNRPTYPQKKIRQWVGNGVEQLTKRALTGQLDGQPDPALFDRGYQLFLECYSKNVSRQSRLYPETHEGLQQLKAMGFMLGSVSNKIAQFTQPLLKDLKIASYFSITVSGDTLAEKKPSPKPLLYAASQLGVQPQNCLMVGDSSNDVQAARAANMAIACVAFGYNHGRDIRDDNPDILIDSLKHLANLLADTDLPSLPDRQTSRA